MLKKQCFRAAAIVACGAGQWALSVQASGSAVHCAQAPLALPFAFARWKKEQKLSTLDSPRCQALITALAIAASHGQCACAQTQRQERVDADQRTGGQPVLKPRREAFGHHRLVHHGGDG